MPDHPDPTPPTLHDYLGVLRRRARIAVPIAVAVPLALVLVTTQAAPTYEATADVLLRKGSQTEGGAPAAQRAANTEARLAETPNVARRALAHAGVAGRTVEDLVAASDVSPSPDSDMLRFRVTDTEPFVAARLADELARAYTGYRRELDTASVQRARAGVRDEIARLSVGSRTAADDDLLRTLMRKDQALRVEQALRPDDAVLVAAAWRPTASGPSMARTIAVGAGLGLIFAVLAAFLAEALDRRVRSASELSRLLGLPLLARLPTPPRRLRAAGRVVMRDDPASVHAEPYRVLRTNVEFFNLEHQARTVVVTSATPGEGKTTTVANLAVALARRGERVVVVDLDLRRPALGHCFGLQHAPGVADVLAYRLSVDEALVPVEAWDRPVDGSGWLPPRCGSLEVLPAGLAPSDVGELVNFTVIGRMLESLSAEATIVLVDGPPLLGQGDGLELCAQVDAVVVVSRLGRATETAVEEARRLLSQSRAAKLGLVVTGTGLSGHDRRAYAAGSRSSDGVLAS